MAFELHRRVRCYHARLLELARLALNQQFCGALDMKVLFATTSLPHLQDDLGAERVKLAPEHIAELEEIFKVKAVKGPRYAPQGTAEVDTENF